MPVVQTLLEEVEQNPYPAAHTSRYWQLEGEQLLVARHDEGIVLRGFGIEFVGRQAFLSHVAHGVERLSYRRETIGLRAYPKAWSLAKHLSQDLTLGVTFDTWRCAVIVATLLEHWDRYGLDPKTFVFIGDGSGFLGALIRRARPGARVICIDLPKSLVFQAGLHVLADPRVRLARPLDLPQDGGTVTLALPQEIDGIREPVDCAVNLASMQEMDPESIVSYFQWLRRRSHAHSRFYCVNRREKALPGGVVIRFEDYPWQAEDEVFLDGPCPYYTHYLSARTVSKGPRLLGIRVPFINYFDGPTWHRLARLAPSNGEAR